MKMCAKCIGFAVFVCSIGMYAAAPEGRLFIQNDHPILQFQCIYVVAGEHRGPVTVYKDKIYLGLVRDITDVQVSRYGKVMGKGAGYYSCANLLDVCKQQHEKDWVLHITWAATGWTVVVKQVEETRHEKIYPNALSYFPKAYQYGLTCEPRHIFDLPASYTKQLVEQRMKALIEQIKADKLPAKLVSNIMVMIKNAAVYAQGLLDIRDSSSPEYKKLLLEWRSKLEPERVIRGKNLACRILNEPQLDLKNSMSTQSEYLNGIIDLMWFLYDKAVEKNQVYDEGTCIVQDADRRFYDFLLNYVKLVNPGIKGTIEDPAQKISLNSYAYSRASSHFVLQQRNNRHYGIDIRFPGAMTAQALLPAQKSHILFGVISDDCIFIKLENVGIASQSVVFHGAEFAIAQARKRVPTLLRYFENTYLGMFNDILMYYIGTDDDPNYRKERIPQDFLQRCFTVAQSGNLTAEQLKDFMYICSAQGIHGVYNEIRNASSPLSQQQKSDLGNYLQQLQAEGLDNQTLRFGREVILSHDELMRSCR
jgi:hypothetical protein